MTLQQLEYIIALNRLGNFAKAADSCDVTQPTLSSMIQKLETELGIKIFDRRRQPITATKAGQTVIRQAKEVLYQSKRLREIVEEEKETFRGTFTIGVLPTIAPYLIPHFFPQLMREYPTLDLRIVELKTKDMKQALLNGDIDSGILAKIEVTDTLFQQLYDMNGFSTIGTKFGAAVDFTSGKGSLISQSNYDAFIVNPTTNEISIKITANLPFSDVSNRYVAMNITISNVGTTTNDFSAFKIAA